MPANPGAVAQGPTKLEAPRVLAISNVDLRHTQIDADGVEFVESVRSLRCGSCLPDWGYFFFGPFHEDLRRSFSAFISAA